MIVVVVVGFVVQVVGFFVALMHMVAGGGGSLMYGVCHQKKPKKVTCYGREDIPVGMHLCCDVIMIDPMRFSCSGRWLRKMLRMIMMVSSSSL